MPTPIIPRNPHRATAPPHRRRDKRYWGRSYTHTAPSPRLGGVPWASFSSTRPDYTLTRALAQTKIARRPASPTGADGRKARGRGLVLRRMASSRPRRAPAWAWVGEVAFHLSFAGRKEAGHAHQQRPASTNEFTRSPMSPCQSPSARRRTSACGAVPRSAVVSGAAHLPVCTPRPPGAHL